MLLWHLVEYFNRPDIGHSSRRSSMLPLAIPNSPRSTRRRWRTRARQLRAGRIRAASCAASCRPTSTSDLFIDVVRSPFIYRRVVAQTTSDSRRTSSPSSTSCSALSAAVPNKESTHAVSTGREGMGPPSAVSTASATRCTRRSAAPTATTSTTTPTARWCATASATSATRCSGSRAGSPSGGRSPSTSARSCVEVAIEEARAVAPDTVIQACTSATSAKDCVELTQHAEAHGRRHLLPADAADGGARRRGRAALLPVRRRPHRHRARHVQLAVVGLRARPGRRRPPIANEIPAVCATKEGTMEHWRSKARARARARARDLGVRHHRVPGGLVAAGHRRCRATRHRRLPLRDPREADAHRLLEPGVGGPARRSHRVRAGDRPRPDQRGGRRTGSRRYPGRPDYFTHWGEAFRYAASVLGLPVGDYPHSRPPQGILPEAAKEQIRKTFENAGLAKQLADT